MCQCFLFLLIFFSQLLWCLCVQVWLILLQSIVFIEFLIQMLVQICMMMLVIRMKVVKVCRSVDRWIVSMLNQVLKYWCQIMMLVISRVSMFSSSIQNNSFCLVLQWLIFGRFFLWLLIMLCYCLSYWILFFCIWLWWVKCIIRLRKKMNIVSFRKGCRICVQGLLLNRLVSQNSVGWNSVSLDNLVMKNRIVMVQWLLCLLVLQCWILFFIFDFLRVLLLLLGCGGLVVMFVCRFNDVCVG